MKKHVKELLEKCVQGAEAALAAETNESRLDAIYETVGWANAALEAEKNPEAVLTIGGEEFGPG